VNREADRASLRARHEERRAAHPREHARDAARALGVSEAALVDAAPRREGGGLGVTPLDRARLRDLFPAFVELGTIKALTRNESAVIERWGAFEQVEAGPGPLGQVVGEAIDLRLFFHHLHAGYAVVEPGRSKSGEAAPPRRSLQLFDEHGDSAFKVYLEDESRVNAYEGLVRRFAAADDAPPRADPPPAPPGSRALTGDEAAAFRAAWDAMTNTHEFFLLLRKHGLARVPALEIAGPARARAVAPSSAREVLVAASAREMPIMIFVGSRGVIQIHTGPVRRVVDMDGWLNVLDRELNVHLREGDVARAFVVRKPTSDGIVTSLELFDAAGEVIALLFSKRKPGQREVPAWGELLDRLEGAS
jgi:putative hemin transport protein